MGRGPLAPPPDVRIASAWWAVGETVREVEGRSTPPGVGRRGTQLATALRAAAARWPGRDLWVFSDGRGTDGDAEAAARAVAAGGGRVHVSAPREPAADVGLLAAAPRRTRGGGAVVDVTLAASTAGRVAVELAREGRTVASQTLDVTAGTERTVSLVDPAVPPVGSVFEVRVEPARGTPNDDPGNDRLAVGVPGTQPEVLVWGDVPVPRWAGTDLPFHVRHMATWEPGAVDTASAVVVASLPWRRIGDERVRELTRYVAGGGRLLVLGGPRSWRAGGWAGTTLEDRLLGLRVPRGEGQELALLLVLDRSGSTWGGALQDLTDAVRAVWADLKPGERLAVLPFGAAPDTRLLGPGWVDGDGGASSAEALVAALDGLVAHGSTDIPAALEAGAERLGAAAARSRRLLLLTDGDAEHEPDLAALGRARAALDASNAVFGAVVSGMPKAAERLARTLARRPEDVVLLERSTEVPSHLLHAVAEIRGEAERLEAPAAVQPVAAGADTALATLEPTWVHALEPSPEGEVVAVAVWPEDGGRSTPFAARRRVGAGEVLALAWGPEAELDPREEGRKLMSVVARLADEADPGLEAALVGGDVEVRLPEAQGAGRLRVLGDDPEASLLEVAPGLFRGAVGSKGPDGVQVVLPDAAGGGARPLRQPAQPVPEHRGVGVDEPALRRLAAAGQGRRVGAGGVPPSPRPPPGPGLGPWFLLLAAILLVVERVGAEVGRPAARSIEEEGRLA